jgi:hypothetical protein
VLQQEQLLLTVAGQQYCCSSACLKATPRQTATISTCNRNYVCHIQAAVAVQQHSYCQSIIIFPMPAWRTSPLLFMQHVWKANMQDGFPNAIVKYFPYCEHGVLDDVDALRRRFAVWFAVQG